MFRRYAVDAMGVIMKAIKLTALITLSTITLLRAAQPQPFGALPSERQLRWHETEVFLLIHFSLNTYTDKEWGYGDEDPKLFNPKAQDADQVIQALKRGGMNGVILVAKHHDGFCLWPTKTTPHNITKASWKEGKGDLVLEYSKSAKKYGLKFGVYCSPWDRNTGKYGTDKYLPMYQAQITELLSNYGPIFEMWFDGANGGDGYYGGAREKRSIDRFTYYDWSNTWGIVRKLQPMACIFGDVGPDSRWVGNEKGYCAEDSWATFNPKGKTDPARPANGDSMNHVEGPAGHKGGAYWIPAECDFPLRKGWFWHPDQDPTVKSPAKLMDIYFHSVGKGGCMNVGVAPNRDGMVCDADIKSLDTFGAALDDLFAVNYAEGAKVKASAVRPAEDADAALYSPDNLIDADRYSYWGTPDTAIEGWVILTLAKEAEFDVVRLRENIKLGYRVENFAVDTWQNGAWKEFAKGKSIGSCRLLRGEKVKSSKLRLRIIQSCVGPCISDVGVFKMPEM